MRGPLAAAQDLVHQRELHLAVALAAQLGAEVAGPQPPGAHLVLERVDDGPQGVVERVEGLVAPEPGRAARPRRGRRRPSSRAASWNSGSVEKSHDMVGEASSSSSATAWVTALAIGMCRDSLGPCALEWGPRTPVATNWVSGKLLCRSARNGMVPPSPTRPRRAPEAVHRRPRTSVGRDVGVERRGDPAVGRRLEVDGDVGPFVGGDGRDQRVGRRLRVDVGRQAERELERGARAAARCRRRGGAGRPSVPVTSRAARPGAGDRGDRPGSGVSRRSPSTVGSGAVGELGRHRGRGWPGARRGSRRPGSSGRRMRPVGLVLDARQDAPQDAERRGHHAAALPAVDALGQHVDPHA